jgi:hypothetical protein
MNKKESHELMERATKWTDDAQDELAESMLNIEARHCGVYVTDKDERAALKKSHDDVRNKRFATEHDIKRVFRAFHRA